MLRWLDDTLLRCAARLAGLLRRERGQTQAEYVVMVTLIAVGAAIVTIIAFRSQVLASFDAIAGCFTSMPC